MTNTISIKILGTTGEKLPLVVPESIIMPSYVVKEFEHYCGAGEGLGNLLVPEKIFGVKVSPACFVHDNMWEIADASWADFHHSNSVFLTNLISLIEHQSKSQLIKVFRLYRAVTYYNAVNTIGAKIFWKIKKKVDQDK